MTTVKMTPEEQRAEKRLPLYRAAGLACMGASAAAVILLFPRVVGTLVVATVALVGWLWLIEQLLSEGER